MGSAIGTLQKNSNFPHEIIEKVIINRDVKREIAIKDAKFLKKELLEEWKRHNEIIKLLTERTKYQLELLTYIFSRANRIGLFFCLVYLSVFTHLSLLFLLFSSFLPPTTPSF